MNTSSNIERSYRKLTLEAVFGDHPLDICFETSLPGEESPCVVGNVNDDPRCAIYASLFAAAPELLAALKELRSYCPPASRNLPYAVCQRVDAAIAKAEGR